MRAFTVSISWWIASEGVPMTSLSGRAAALAPLSAIPVAAISQAAAIGVAFIFTRDLKKTPKVPVS
jgi:hypothetical protein